MAIFATNERLTFNDIQRHHGPVLKLVDIAENYIKSNIHWRVEFTGTLQRTEIPEIPVDAISYSRCWYKNFDKVHIMV